MTRRATRNAAANHPPLAFDRAGAPVLVPEGTIGWRLKRQTSGRPRVIVSPVDRQPVLLPLDTTPELVVETYGPATYRLEAIDAAGQADYVTTLHLEDDDDDDQGDDGDPRPQRTEAARVGTAFESPSVVRHLLDTVRMMAQANAETTRSMVDAHARMARHNAKATRSVVDAQARWIDALASNKAVPGALPGIVPPALPSVRNALLGPGAVANDDDGDGDDHGDDDQDPGEDDDQDLDDDQGDDDDQDLDDDQGDDHDQGNRGALAAVEKITTSVNGVVGLGRDALKMFGVSRMMKTAPPAALPEARNAAPSLLAAAPPVDAELVDGDPDIAAIAAQLTPEERAVFAAKLANPEIGRMLRTLVFTGKTADELVPLVRELLADATRTAAPAPPVPVNPMLHLAAIQERLTAPELRVLSEVMREDGEAVAAEMAERSVDECVRYVRQYTARLAAAKRRRAVMAAPSPSESAPELAAVPVELPVEVSAPVDSSAVNFNALAMAVAQHLTAEEIAQVLALVPCLSAERTDQLLRLLVPLSSVDAAAWVRENLPALVAEVAAA